MKPFRDQRVQNEGAKKEAAVEEEQVLSGAAAMAFRLASLVRRSSLFLAVDVTCESSFRLQEPSFSLKPN